MDATCATRVRAARQGIHVRLYARRFLPDCMMAGWAAWCMAGVAAMTLGCDHKTSGPPSRGANQAPAPELLASSARLEGTLLLVEAQLINHSDRPMELRTNFASVFDGVRLEVIAADGSVVARAHYTHHQSPYTSEGRPIALAAGSTVKVLGVPFEGALPSSAHQVRLVGDRQFYGTRTDLRSAPVVIRKAGTR